MTRNISAPERLSHPFPALYDQNSRVLILGSFPSVKSARRISFTGIRKTAFGA